MMKQSIFLLPLLLMVFSCTVFSINHSKQEKKRHFFFSVEAIAARRLNNGTDFVARDFRKNDKLPDASIVDINTNYKLSPSIDIGTLLNNGIDITLSMLVNNHSDKHAVSPPNIPNLPESSSNVLADVPFYLLALLLPADFDKGSIALQSDSVLSYKNVIANLTLGYWYPMNNIILFHPNLGLNLSHIQTTKKTSYLSMLINNEFSNDASGHVLETSKVTAIGPFLGLDFAYTIYKPFSFSLNTKLGLLAGKINTAFYAAFLSKIVGVPSKETYVKNKGDISFVEYIEIQAAINYRFNILRTQSAEIKVGYHVSKYLDNGETYRFIDDSSEDLLSHFFKHNGFHGPFLKLLFYS